MRRTFFRITERPFIDDFASSGQAVVFGYLPQEGRLEIADGFISVASLSIPLRTDCVTVKVYPLGYAPIT